MLLRIITGIAGIALAAFIIQAGGSIFAGAVTLLAVLAWHEFARAFAQHGQRLCYLSGIAVLLLLMGCTYWGTAEEFLAVAVIGTFFMLLLAVLLHGRISIDAACISIAGVFYIGFAFSHLLMLRFLETEGGAMLQTLLGETELGCALVWTALIGTWASDTFAYFAGSMLGSHKLCPTISPGKTVEGFLGGFIGTVFSVMAVGGLFFSFGIMQMAVLGIGIAIIAPLGDLVESVIKRHTGIKDSGRLIPGHGGVLDRFDSVMFTAPLVYYFHYFAQLFGIIDF